MIVRCPSCFRVETWDGSDRSVVTEGGARRPADHADLAAWKVLRAARRGETGPVVAACAACELPMVAEPGAGATPMVWTLATPDGELVVGPELLGPSGILDERQANAWMEAQFRRRWDLRPGRALFSGALLTLMSVPVLLWLLAISTVTVFLLNYGRQ